MPKLFFVKQERPEKARLLCQLTEHFFSRNAQRILIYLQEPEQAIALDRFLWTWDKASFLPHGYDSGAVDCHSEAIVITSREDNTNNADILIMGNPCSTDFIQHFNEVIDLAEVYEDTLASQSRDRFRSYRESGFAPEMLTL